MSDIANAMQNPSQPSYHGSYQPQSNAYPGAQYYDHRVSYDYATQNTPNAQSSGGGGYGLYNTPAQHNIQATTYGSSSGSYDGPRASKRARLDAQEDATPSRTSSSWQPAMGGQSQYANQQQFRGLALPLMPTPRTVDGHNRHDVQDGGTLGPQPGRPNDISSNLEQQVRGLAEYHHHSNDRHSTSASAQQRDGTRASHDTTSGHLDASSPQLLLPQRGARDGNVLNLSCVMCMKKKRKCSKNFPCNECQKFQDECVPSVRKMRSSGVSNVDDEGDAPNEGTEDATIQEPAAAPEPRVIRDHNDPNRRYLMNLPRVVDGYQEWSNMRTKYNPIPEDLDEVREKLFKLEKPLLLNSQQYADYWPHVSNIWARGVGPWWDTNGSQMETWECRNQRRQSRHQRIKEPGGQGLRKRERKLHLLEGTEMCKLRFRLTAHIKHAENNEDHKKGLGVCNCVPEWMFLERMKASADLAHNHTLDSLDKYKRTDAMLFFAEHKVIEGGYLYASVRKWVQDKYSHLTKAVTYLTDHDVANAARRWRVQHRHLELVETIPESSPEDERREKCLELIPTTTNDGFQQALKEICKQLPEATKIALQYLESAQIEKSETATKNSKILEGDEIVIPLPGIPGHRLNTRFKSITPKEMPAQPVANQNLSSGSPAQHSMQQSQPQQPQHQLTTPNVPPQYPNPQHQPLLPPPHPAQSQLPPLAPMAPPPPVTNKWVPDNFRVYQPRVETSPPKPPDGAYSVISGGHRLYVPATGSKVTAQFQDTRPSWAQPGAAESTGTNAKAKANVESDESRVQRQLEAELRPLSDS